jgi:hypothetical protein
MSAEQNTDSAHHTIAHAIAPSKHETAQHGEHQAGHHGDHSAEKAHTHAATEAHHNLAQEAFAPPRKHQVGMAHSDKAVVKDHDLETFKHNVIGHHSVVMHLVPAPTPGKDGHGISTNTNKIRADVEVASDGSLKWNNQKSTSNGAADHAHHNQSGKDKPLVVAFEPGKPAPGAKGGDLSAKQVERLKQMVACLGDSHTHTEIDKNLQDKAHVHIIPADQQDKMHSNVLIAATRHGSHDPASGQWSGGNGSLYRHGQSEKLSAPPASAMAHLGNAGKEETTFMQKVAPTDRPQIKDFVDKLVWAISGNEGKYTTVNPNDAGHGISIGIRQWNQKAGELPDLLRSWHDQDPAKFESMFGKYSSSLLNERFVRGTDFWHEPGLMDDIKKALADQEFQQVQLNLARQFVVNSVQLGYDDGFRSELALADIADVINQCGSGGFSRALRQGIKMAGSEQNSVVAMEHVLHRPDGPQRLHALSKTFSIGTAAHIANA